MSVARYKIILDSLKPQLEKIQLKLAEFLDVGPLIIPYEISFHPRKINFAKYTCKVSKDSLHCDLIHIHLDIYDIEETMKFLKPSQRDDLLIYLFAHEYAHFLLFLKEPTLFHYRPNLLTQHKKKLPALYREGYSIYELFADTLAARIKPKIHDAVLKHMDTDYVGEPYASMHKKFLKLSKKEFLLQLKNWKELSKHPQKLSKVKHYKVFVKTKTA